MSNEYQVWINIGASACQTITAETPEDAIDKAEFNYSLCHHCSREVELCDGSDFTVELDGEVLLEESYTSDLHNENKKLRERIKQLEAGSDG